MRIGEGNFLFNSGFCMKGSVENKILAGFVASVAALIVIGWLAYRCKDGSWRWFAWNARAAVPQRLIYAAGRDITERKRTQAHITQLNADLQNRATQLEAANKELEAFSYSVSHDLRAPLRHIDGFVKLLDKQAGEKLDERGRRYLDIIADSARQMGMLIDDLLVFSRMSRAELRHARVSLDALVHEAIHGLQGEMNDRPIHWIISAAGASLPVTPTVCRWWCCWI